MFAECCVYFQKFPKPNQLFNTHYSIHYLIRLPKPSPAGAPGCWGTEPEPRRGGMPAMASPWPRRELTCTRGLPDAVPALGEVKIDRPRKGLPTLRVPNRGPRSLLPT